MYLNWIPRVQQGKNKVTTDTDNKPLFGACCGNKGATISFEVMLPSACSFIVDGSLSYV
jgi:hypothetical protein